MDLDALLSEAQAVHASEQAALDDAAVRLAAAFEACEGILSEYRALCRRIAVRAKRAKLRPIRAFVPDLASGREWMVRSAGVEGWPAARRLLLTDGRLVGLPPTSIRTMPSGPPNPPSTSWGDPQKEAFLYRTGMVALVEKYCLLDSLNEALRLRPGASRPELAGRDLKFGQSSVLYCTDYHEECPSTYVPLEEILARALVQAEAAVVVPD